MANAEHLEILKQGVEIWNKWRAENLEISPDLTGANLKGTSLNEAMFIATALDGAILVNAYLNRANLAGASLTRVDLTGATVIEANISDTNLTRANLSKVNLRGSTLNRAKLTKATLDGTILLGARLVQADLSKAVLTSAALIRVDLTDANLSYAKLTNADLTGARLIGTNLTGAILVGVKLEDAIFSKVESTDADFSQMRLSGCVFAGIDFRRAKGLESVRHFGPSVLAVNSLALSGGLIPEEFLRGCGLQDWEIESAKLYRTDLTRNQIVDYTYKVIELRSDPLIQFYSCFISYSSKDEEFARRLYSDLQKNGVRCWFAPDDMKIGDRIRYRIDNSIRLHDKLLLILSETSISSQWLEQEVETALEKEREQGCDVLFPVRLDDKVMNMRSGWPALIRNTRHIGDFRRWRDRGEYQMAFSRLLSDLRVEDLEDLEDW